MCAFRNCDLRFVSGVEVADDLVDDALKMGPLLLESLGHDLAPLLLEDALDVLHVDAGALFLQQVRDARGDLLEEVVHGALLQSQVHRAAPQAVDRGILPSHRTHQGKALVALDLVVRKLGVMRLDELIELVLHLLHGAVP